MSLPKPFLLDYCDGCARVVMELGNGFSLLREKDWWLLVDEKGRTLMASRRTVLGTSAMPMSYELLFDEVVREAEKDHGPTHDEDPPKRGRA